MKRWETYRGKLDQIKSSRLFETLVIIVIVVSAISVGAHTYPLPPGFIKSLAIIDDMISIIFCVEIGIRILAEHKTRNFFRSGWNIFDFTIVTVSLIPIANSEVVWVARLVRIFRVLRLISYVPQLRIIIDALWRAIPRIGYVVLLMFILFYIYATVGSIFFGDINPALWGNVSIAMLTLFKILTMEGWVEFLNEIMPVYSMSWIYFLTFIFFVAFIFLNIMVAIVIDAWQEGQQSLRESLQEDMEDEENGEGAPKTKKRDNS